MDNEREVAQSYGRSFDNLVGMVADAMMAAGYRSRHASRRSNDKPAKSELVNSVVSLGFYCAKMEAALSGPPRPGRGDFPGEGFLSIYAAAKRLLVLYRYAQSYE